MKRELIVIVENTETSESSVLPIALPTRNNIAQEVSMLGGVLRPGFRKPLSTPAPETFASLNALTAIGDAPPSIPDLSTFLRVEAADNRLEKLRDAIRQNSSVVAAYIQPVTQLPALNNMLPSPSTPSSLSPDFQGRQGYLNASPEGVDAHYAWSQPGGAGSGVQVIDIEWAWNLTHEDLIEHQAPLFAGTPRDGTKGG